MAANPIRAASIHTAAMPERVFGWPEAAFGASAVAAAGFLGGGFVFVSRGGICRVEEDPRVGDGGVASGLDGGGGTAIGGGAGTFGAAGRLGVFASGESGADPAPCRSLDPCARMRCFTS